MSVSSVKPFANTQGGVDAEGTTTYTNVYHVYTDDKDDAANTARGSAAVALGLPDYNDSWAWGNDSNAYALAKTRNAVLSEISDNTPYYRKWTVTIGYTTAGQSRDPAGGGGSGSGSEEGVQDPLQEPWKLSGSYIQTTRRTSVDKNGANVTNSADEPILFDVPSGYDSLIMTGNTATLSLTTRARSVTKCNSTAMWGLAIRQVYLNQWSWDIAYRGTTPYIVNRLEWWIARPISGFPTTNDGLWNEWVIDWGTQTKDAVIFPAPQTYTPITGKDVKLGGAHLDLLGQRLDMSLPANAGGRLLPTITMIKEADFLGTISFLTNPLIGPFV